MNFPAFRLRLALAIVISCIAILLARTASSADASCNRDCLIGVADAYLAALVKRDPKGLPLAATVKFTENGKVLKFGEGLWKTAASLRPHRQIYADAVNASVSSYNVVEESPATERSPVVLSVRIKAPGGKITEVETIVTRKGDHATYNPAGFTQPRPVFDTIVPVAQRSSRAELQKFADNYFEALEKHRNELVAADPACDRIENGMVTTHSKVFSTNGCGHSMDRFWYIPAIYGRRYFLIDEERGIAVAMAQFRMPGEVALPPPPGVKGPPEPRPARTLLVNETFKIIGGKIVAIDATMINLPFEGPSGW